VVKTIALSVKVEAGTPKRTLRGQEAVAHDRAGYRLVGGHLQGGAAVVVQPGQDLGVTSGCRGRPGERIVGEIRLPALVRQLCLEPLVGGLGALGGLWGD
jgi:hypothetical protein